MLDPKQPERYSVGRVNVSCVNKKTALECICRHVRLDEPNYICVTNTRAVSIYSKKWDDYRDIQNNSLLSVPDGMPLVWIARAYGLKDVSRVTGYSIMKSLFKEGHSHYFFGDTQDTLDDLEQYIQTNYPKAKIAGMHSPPFRDLTEDEVKQTADEINQLNPDFIWIGIGAPKQERFMVRIIPYLNRGILVGVGAAFRLIIGEYGTAHPIVQRLALEGFFWRIRTDPMRMVKRYPIMIPFILKCVIKANVQRIGNMIRKKPFGV
jgi:N-acetylglucosaminyldiphosphoundecaprenol N-acetyl-beta-D-mannosaminyltransferase